MSFMTLMTGFTSACTCSTMREDGTVAERRFLKLPAEYDSLQHKIDHIKRARHHGYRRVSNLWAYADDVNKDIVVKTAQFVTDTAVLHVNSMQLRCYHCVLSQRVHTGKQVWKHANLVM